MAIVLSGSGSSSFSSSLSTGSIAASGDITATGNVTAYFSDDRLKTKISIIENALEKLAELEGFHYEANETAVNLGYTKKPEVGLSAQSVQKVLPEAVTSAPIDAAYLAVQYEKLIPLLVQAIKELNDKVESMGSKT